MYLRCLILRMDKQHTRDEPCLVIMWQEPVIVRSTDTAALSVSAVRCYVIYVGYRGYYGAVFGHGIVREECTIDCNAILSSFAFKRLVEASWYGFDWRLWQRVECILLLFLLLRDRHGLV